MRNAAGILLVRADGAVLLVRRSGAVSDAGSWGIPGGGLKRGEHPLHAAFREFKEEMGSVPRVTPQHTYCTRSPRGYFTTIMASISTADASRWRPQLNWEHTDWGWFYIDDLPTPLHPGVELILGSL